MSPRTILQIVPRRTSQPDGIGDYAVRLATGLKERHGIASVFVSGTPPGAYPPADDGWPSAAVASRSSRALVEAFELAERRSAFSAILLHVAGYGYQKRGAPLWLLQGMRQWRRNEPGKRLIGVFHELYATGRVWNSSFWFGPLQKHVARELWELADGGLTTNSREFPDLLAWRPAAADRLVLMPVVSAVGEPVEVSGVNERPPRAAVFSMPGVEARLYRAHGETFAAAVRELGIREIVDIGVRRTPPPSTIGGATVACLGWRSAAAIGRELLDCRYGFLAYDVALLGKSSVFAAYAAHGVIPVCIGSRAPPGNGLVPGRHFLRPPLTAMDAPALASMQRHIVAWYREHDMARLARSVVALCSDAPLSGDGDGAVHGIGASTCGSPVQSP